MTDRQVATRRALYPRFSSVSTRWGDNDAYGHVNNVVYYSFFDTAVNQHLIECGVLDVALSPAIGLVVENRCRYFTPIGFPDRIDVGMRVLHLGNSSVRYEIALFRNDADLASAVGHFVHVYVDRANNRPVSISRRRARGARSVDAARSSRRGTLMEMSGQARLNATRQQVWDALNDPRVLAVCIPGCESMDKTSDTEFAATVVSKVGPIKARFAGKVTLTDVVAPQRYTLVGEGQGGMAGFAKADIGVSLEAVEEHVTLLNYGVKANVGGKLAQLGARLIDATARKSADEFFDKFTAEVERRVAEAPGAIPRPASIQPSPIVAKATTRTRTRPIAAPTAVAAPDPGAVDVLVSEQIKVWIADRIAVVTFNRPKQRNAMTFAMWRAVPSLMASLDRDPAVRTIVVTGAGDDFCAGADISEFATVRDDVDQATAYEVAVDACCDAITHCTKPTIAVVKGYCLGGGAHLAMSCDFRYAAASAQFGIPAARLSVIYGVGGTRKLLALVGLATAKKILFGGQRFDAAEALRIGFVDHVAGSAAPASTGGWFSKRATPAPAGDPMIDARAFARQLAHNAPLSIVGAKTILNDIGLAHGDLDLAKIDALIAAGAASDDYQEGRAAFAEKRDPVFKGS